MWADNETSEDLLGFKVHADLLIDVINDDAVLPVTIGVFGDWGSGKSSILKIVQEELSGDNGELKDGTLVLHFNGWVFEGYDDAKAALLESIIEKFNEHKTIGNKVKDNTKKLLNSVHWMRALGLGFKKVILPGAAAYMTGGLSLAPFLLKEFEKLDPNDLTEKLNSDDGEEFINSILRQNDRKEITLVREFREDFKELIDKSEIKKLVVIIDDLDRCTPERLIENLEAIKLFLNVEKTAFVIGADPRIVRHAIEFRYNTDGIENSDDLNSRNKRIVSDYLEKLIQIPYNLPRLSDSEVETYMTLLFCKKELGESFDKVLIAFNESNKKSRYGTFGVGNLDGVISATELSMLGESSSLIASLSSIIAEGLEGNPRQVKRFLNTFTLRNRLVNVAGIPDFRVDILAKLMVLEYSMPSLFRKIYEWQSYQKGEPKEIIELELLATDSNTDGIKSKFDLDWASEKVLNWLRVEPKLSNLDLRDYYWVSRDQLHANISGASLIPNHLRFLFKELVEHGSGSILASSVGKKVSNLSESEIELLVSLLEKELSKKPDDVNVHKVFIELMNQSIPQSIESYIRIIRQVDQTKIPFSLRNEFKIAENKNPAVKSVYDHFEKGSMISKALNQK